MRERLAEAVVTRLVMVMTVSFLSLALAQSSPSTILLTGAAVAVLAAAIASRLAAGVVSVPEMRVGARAREHREVLAALPEPQHPDTEGRPRSRTPSRVVSATPLPVA